MGFDAAVVGDAARRCGLVLDAATLRVCVGAVRGIGVVRLAMDVGSGKTKALVCRVLRAGGADGAGVIVQELFSRQVDVPLKIDLIAQGGHLLSEPMLQRCFDTLAGFAQRARELGATECKGIATAVFRHADNGAVFLQRVKRSLGLDIEIVEQAVEGRIGFLTAVQAARTLPAAEVISWDSGGGSFQVCAHLREEGGPARLMCWDGPIGSSSALAFALGIQGRAFEGDAPTANPMSAGELSALEGACCDAIAAAGGVPAWLRAATSDGRHRIVAIGGSTSIFNIGMHATGRPDFGLADVEAAAARFAAAATCDAEFAALGFPEPAFVMVKLALLVAVLRLLEAASVGSAAKEETARCLRCQYQPTNGSCTGVALACF